MEGWPEKGDWCDLWTALTGSITPDQIIHAARSVGDQLGLLLEQLASDTLHLVTVEGVRPRSS